MISATWLSLACACLREAITSCSWRRIERAAAAAVIPPDYRICAALEMEPAAPERLSQPRVPPRTDASGEGKFFLDFELPLLECLDHRAVGSGPRHFFLDTALQPLVLGLKGCDMRGFHTRSPYPERVSPARLERPCATTRGREASRAIVIKSQKP